MLLVLKLASVQRDSFERGRNKYAWFIDTVANIRDLPGEIDLSQSFLYKVQKYKVLLWRLKTANMYDYFTIRR